MKTSVIEVHEMLSVLSVDDVETRIGEVAGVESVTVNFAAGTATVRYDETRLEATDIKSIVRQNANASTEPDDSSDNGHEGHATTTPDLSADHSKIPTATPTATPTAAPTAAPTVTPSSAPAKE